MHASERLGKVDLSPKRPADATESEGQKKSLAELPRLRKFARYEKVSEEVLVNYHSISCKPITKNAENDMELVSDIVTWGERYLYHWEIGTYKCSRCLQPLYSSHDKYKGPCVWPSFRKSVDEVGVSISRVFPYNQYTVAVDEVYCGNCDLFIGHRFEDGKQKGDTHPEAHWRH